MIRTYSELSQWLTFEERFAYLRLRGDVGKATFGFDRHINQRFYRSHEWKTVRNHVISRDDGCDLGDPTREIHDRILIHHMNPMGIHDILDGADWVLDPEYLITTTHTTHNAIHYSDETLLPKVVASREPGDTKLW